MICPKCGTEDCLSENPNVRIDGPGIIKTDSVSILRTCNARRQLKALSDKSPQKDEGQSLNAPNPEGGNPTTAGTGKPND